MATSRTAERAPLSDGSHAVPGPLRVRDVDHHQSRAHGQRHGRPPTSSRRYRPLHARERDAVGNTFPDAVAAPCAPTISPASAPSVPPLAGAHSDVSHGCAWPAAVTYVVTVITGCDGQRQTGSHYSAAANNGPVTHGNAADRRPIQITVTQAAGRVSPRFHASAPSRQRLPQLRQVTAATGLLGPLRQRDGLTISTGCDGQLQRIVHLQRRAILNDVGTGTLTIRNNSPCAGGRAVCPHDFPASATHVSRGTGAVTVTQPLAVHGPLVTRRGSPSARARQHGNGSSPTASREYVPSSRTGS